MKQGQPVVFFPSERTLKKFEGKQKESYHAVVNDVNENSVDLTVFGCGEMVFVTKVQIEGLAPEGRSYYTWPEPQAE